MPELRGGDLAADLITTHATYPGGGAAVHADFLYELGWRKVAPVDADESESTGDVNPVNTELKMLRSNFPGKCIVLAPSGRYAVPWAPQAWICGIETNDGADLCTWHGGPGYPERIP